ncbi:hypothetical protein [Eisenbergiella tayi]|uniref:Uncharacterized protein n=1 Tax=Eisenbergiella tayi TaxID=1432052 RepID=A0A1E3A4M8_9FIRM|nr:hypothetical protein [Eisenbergiella tayi]ODM03176.1 hypothetical protein BEI61_03970 [Eisenbergiella tayi]
MNATLEKNVLQEKREDSRDFAQIVEKLSPEQKRRAFDILTGFSLAGG